MIKIGTVFSGVGAFEQALKNLKIPHDIVFASDNGEREIQLDEVELNASTIDEANLIVDGLYSEHKRKNFVEMTYRANNVQDFDFYQDVRFINGDKYKGKIDVLVGGSPCQSFSVMGKRAGLDDTRGTLFFDYAKLIKSIQPRIFIFENVPGLLTHDKGKTWNVIKNVFEELGYNWKMKILNSKNFGIPQNRKRLFVIGFKELKDHDRFYFPEPFDLQTTMFDFLEKNIDDKYYLAKKGFEFVTNPKYRNRARINKDIIMTQKANQQFNWNGDFVFEKVDETKYQEGGFIGKAYVGIHNSELGVIRKLTPRECFNLMGFPKTFTLPKSVPDVQLYRQSGNSIVVKVFENIINNLDLL